MNGGKVFMEFPGGHKLWIRSADVQRAMKEDGAKYVERPTARRVLDAAPTAGGIGGSIAGGVAGAVGGPGGALAGRMIGGVAGGTAGKLVQEGGYRAMGFPDAPGTVGEEAAFQAGSGLLGEAGGGVLRVGGKLAVRSGIVGKGSEAVRAVNEMVRNRLPVGGPRALFGMQPPPATRHIPVVGPSLVRGGAVAESERKAAVSARNAVNRWAGAVGHRVPRNIATDVVERLMKLSRDAPEGDVELKYLSKRLKWLLSKPQNLTPERAERIRSQFDRAAKSVHRAIKAKGEADPVVTTRKQYAKDVADALREYMHKMIPGHREASGKLSSAIAARDAIFAGEAHPSIGRMVGRGTVGGVLGGAAGVLVDPNDVRGGSVGSAAGGLLANSPQAMSRLGLLFTDPLLQLILRQAPRAVPHNQEP